MNMFSNHNMNKCKPAIKHFCFWRKVNTGTVSSHTITNEIHKHITKI